MAIRQAYLDHLARVPLFATCSTKDLQKIAKASDEIAVKAGTTLTDQGQQGREAFIVVDGSATVKRNGRKITSVGPGAVIGELSLLDRGPRTATVTADTDMTVLVIDQRNFAGVIDQVPALAHKLLATLAGRIRDLDRANYG
jgi:CRP/FNR family transcriptional regulator, cyclic AMP receptor protein